MKNKTKILSRLTELSLPDLIELSTKNEYPRCLIVNDIGVICSRGEDDGTGENFLLSVINDADSRIRAIAFCCLSILDGAKEKYSNIFKEFRANPKNIALLEEIDNLLEEVEE